MCISPWIRRTTAAAIVVTQHILTIYVGIRTRFQYFPKPSPAWCYLLQGCFPQRVFPSSSMTSLLILRHYFNIPLSDLDRSTMVQQQASSTSQPTASRSTRKLKVGPIGVGC